MIKYNLKYTVSVIWIRCINTNEPLESTYNGSKTDCNEMQSKAHNFPTFSTLSPCDNSLQATAVYPLKVHCASTSAKTAKQPPTITKRNQKRTQVF